MGLEISFSKAAADKAGITYALIPNGTLEEIISAHEDNYSDRGYIEWLSSNELCMIVPTTDWHRSISIFHGKITMRPGHSYSIITEWLSLHNIEWAEF